MSTPGSGHKPRRPSGAQPIHSPRRGRSLTNTSQQSDKSPVKAMRQEPSLETIASITNPGKNNVLSRASVTRFSTPSRRKDEEDTSYAMDEIVQGSGFRLYTEYSGHRSHVKGCAFNPTNQTIATLDEKGICLWEKGIEHLRFTFPPHSYNSITAIQFDPYTNAYYAASLDWSIKTYTTNFQLVDSVPSNQRTVLCLVFHPKQSVLISGAVGTIQIWKVERRQPNVNPSADEVNSKLSSIGIIKTEQSLWIESIHLCEYNQNRFYAVSGKSFYVYDLAQQKQLDARLNLHSHSITGVVFYEPSHYYITSSKDGSIKIWEYFTGTLLHTFLGHAKGVTGLLLHPSPHLLVSSSFDCTVRLWDLDLHEEVEDYRLNQIQGIWGIAKLNRQRFIAFCADVTRVFEFNYVVASFAITRSPVMHLERVTRKHGTSRILALCQDSSVRLFRPTTGLPTCIAMIDADHERVDSALYSGRLELIIMLHMGGSISLWGTTDVHCPLIAMWEQPSRDTVLCIALCYGAVPPIVFGSDVKPEVGDVEFLVGGTDDGWIEVWLIHGNHATDKLPYTRWEAHKHPVCNMCYVPKEHALVTISAARQLIVWNLEFLTPLHEFACHPRPQVMKAGGSHVLIGHFDGKVTLFDINSRRPKRQTLDVQGGSDHAHCVTAADYLPELNMFMTCSLDGLVKLWRPEKELVRDMSTSQGLLAITFLNSMGDFVMGIRNNVSVTRAPTYLPQGMRPDRPTSPKSPGPVKKSLRHNRSRRNKFGSPMGTPQSSTYFRRSTVQRMSQHNVIERLLFTGKKMSSKELMHHAYGDLTIVAPQQEPKLSASIATQGPDIDSHFGLLGLGASMASNTTAASALNMSRTSLGAGVPEMHHTQSGHSIALTGASSDDESVSTVGSDLSMLDLDGTRQEYQAPIRMETDLSLPPVPEWKKRGEEFAPGTSGNPTDIYDIDPEEDEVQRIVQELKDKEWQDYMATLPEDEEKAEEEKKQQTMVQARKARKRDALIFVAERVREEVQKEQDQDQHQPDTSISKVKYKETKAPKGDLYFKLPQIRTPRPMKAAPPTVQEDDMDSEHRISVEISRIPSTVESSNAPSIHTEDEADFAELARLELEMQELERVHADLKRQSSSNSKSYDQDSTGPSLILMPVHAPGPRKKKKKGKGKRMSRPKPGAMQPITFRSQSLHTHHHPITEICQRCDPRNRKVRVKGTGKKKQPIFRPAGP